MPASNQESGIFIMFPLSTFHNSNLFLILQTPYWNY